MGGADVSGAGGRQHGMGAGTSGAEGAVRAGQAAFNRLAETRPELADSIRGTADDPFYDDARLPAFRARLHREGACGPCCP